MRRISHAILALVALVGFVVAAAPLRADEGHCARPAVAPAEHHAGMAHVMAAAAASGLSGEHPCPACPARSCGAMHGCPSTPQLSAEPATVLAVVLPGGRATMPGPDAVPSSVTRTPPTPPPLVALSIA